MTLTFVAPSPNCGHGGSTFTWFGPSEAWLCPLCFTSLGGLLQRCHGCGRPPAHGTQLVDTYRAGRLCTSCRRDHLAARRT